MFWRDGRILCQHCGVKGDGHRAIDGKCPATSSFGVSTPDPMSNWTLEGATLDAALAAFWDTSTTYKPMD